MRMHHLKKKGHLGSGGSGPKSNQADKNEYKLSLRDALLQFRLLKYLILESSFGIVNKNRRVWAAEIISDTFRSEGWRMTHLFAS